MHCVKSVQIRSYFWSVFSCIWIEYRDFSFDKFSVLRKEKMCKTKTTEWRNELKTTENELKMKICSLTLYLNHFSENKLMFRRTLKNFFFLLFYFFCGIVKLICELRRTFFINLRLRQILILRSSTLFFKKICVLQYVDLLIPRSGATPTPPYI